MTAAPAWSSVDETTADLLDLLAEEHPATCSEREEWDIFCTALLAASDENDVIWPNTLRPLVRGHIKPSRIGAFTHRALARGLVAYTGEYQVSDDTESRNGGKPGRVMRLLIDP